MKFWRARDRQPARPLAWLVIAWLVALMAGCGPGVGGSGTGPEPNSTSPAPTLPVPSLHVDTFDGGQVQAVLEASLLRVHLACPRLQFEGRWNGQPGPLLVFIGSLDGNPDRPATAEVLLIERTLRLTLRDGAGTALLGPLLLPSVAVLPPLGGCVG